MGEASTSRGALLVFKQKDKMNALRVLTLGQRRRPVPVAAVVVVAATETTTKPRARSLRFLVSSSSALSPASFSHWSLVITQGASRVLPRVHLNKEGPPYVGVFTNKNCGDVAYFLPTSKPPLTVNLQGFAGGEQTFYAMTTLKPVPSFGQAHVWSGVLQPCATDDDCAQPPWNVLLTFTLDRAFNVNANVHLDLNVSPPPTPPPPPPTAAASTKVGGANVPPSSKNGAWKRRGLKDDDEIWHTLDL